jgi:hypothetical protein
VKKIMTLFFVLALGVVPAKGEIDMFTYIDKRYGFSFNYPVTWRAFPFPPFFKDDASSISIVGIIFKAPKPTIWAVGGPKNDSVKQSIDDKRLDMMRMDENEAPKLIQKKVSSIAGVKITREIFTFTDVDTASKGVMILTDYTSVMNRCLFTFSMSADWYAKNGSLIQSVLDSYKIKDIP